MGGKRQSSASRKEAAETSSLSEPHVPSEQQDAELMAAEDFQLSMELIGEAAHNMEDSFAIGGCEAYAQPVLLVYDSQDAEKTSDLLELPSQGADEGALENLMAACSVADHESSPTEVPAERVLGSSFGDALKLDPDNFDLHFDLGETSILTHIINILAPDAPDLRCELCQLNIYKPGSFSKAHVDTLHSKYTVGTLVIALPSIHEGGQLTVRHGKRKQVYDWSLTDLPDEPLVQWAAFYADCVHEVHKVVSGVHITAVYNLMAGPTPAPYLKAMNISSAPLEIQMEYALAQPSFFGRGGTLRFACQHMYPYVKNRAFVPLDNQPQLKGADACLVAMAQSLHLAVRIRLCPNFDPHCNATSVCEKDATQVCMEYGGDHPPVLVYSHAVIDVHVPAWRQRRDVGYGPFRIVKGDHHVRRTDSLLQTTIPEKAIAE